MKILRFLCRKKDKERVFKTEGGYFCRFFNTNHCYFEKENMAYVIDSYQWLQQYERLKTDFQGRRKFAPNLTNVDSKDMLERISALEKQLNIMRESPMEYEMYAL